MGVLDGKVAVVAGGTSGIGARIAELFVAEGARTVIASPFVEEGEDLAAKLGADARFHRTDVAEEAQVAALVAAAVAAFGRLDCMVNNAGIAERFGGIAGLDMAQYERTFAVVLSGVVLGTKHAAAVMLRQGSGSIINTGSVAGSRAGYGPYDYCAAKAAVIHFTRCVAMELGEKGVRANSISPGGIVTPIFAKALNLPPEQVGQTFAPLEADAGQMASDPARRPSRRHRPGGALPGERRRELRQRPRPRGRWRPRRRPQLGAAARRDRGAGAGTPPAAP